MEKFTYYAPTKIVFGKGTEMQAGKLAADYGATRVFLIFGGQSAIRSGIIRRVEKSLEDAGLPSMSMGGVVPNPLLSTARKMLDAARKFEADFIIGIGGGSVIDTAKAVALGLAHPGADIWDFWIGKAPADRSIPIGAILTISAAGSETSNSAVITNDDTSELTKRGLNVDANRCRFAIMNPELTMTLPAWQIGAGAADIFMHTAERYFAAILGNHLTDEIAEGLFRTIIEYGPKGLADPHNYEAMSEIMWCGSVSHVGLTGLGSKGDSPRDGDWACHQLGMAVSALYDSTHGATLTAVWGSWARYVCNSNISRFAQFARKVYGITEADDALASKQGIIKTEEFFHSLGMPLSLTELLGHTPSDEEIDALTNECSYNGSRKIGGFKILDKNDIKAIYTAAK